MRVKSALENAAARLRDAGVDTPRLDAELLLAHATGRERFSLITGDTIEITEEEQGVFSGLLERRIAREPVAYLTGAKEFYSLEYMVNREVLIPRPETELLVDCAIYYARQEGRVIDVGTGSGAIAVSLQHNRPDLALWAVDISKGALKVAKENARLILGDHRIRFLQGDLFGPVKGMTFDVIVSNPPYVDPGTKDELCPDILHEPETALFAGDRGREIIRRIINEAGEYLETGGALILEMGDGMKEFVFSTSETSGYGVSVLSDYAGRPRVAVLRKG